MPCVGVSKKGKQMENQLETLSKQLKQLVLFSGIQAISIAIFIIFVIGFIAYESLKAERTKNEVKIIVANTNLVVGTVIQKRDLAYDILLEEDAPENSLKARYAPLLLGRTIIKPIKFGEPVVVEATDIIPTNKEIRQQ